MPRISSSKANDRVFVRNGRRHYRRSYSSTELRIGLVLLVLLSTLVGWIAWRGAHPDPDLYSTELPLIEGGTQAVEVERSVEFAGGPRAIASESGAKSEVGSGPLPAGLTREGWTSGEASRFGPDNLYEKINGREGYFKSFGFKALHFVTLERDEDPSTVVDIEMFDLGTAPNALGAYAGERSPGITPDVDDAGMSHIERNALLMTRGRFYVRAIGSDESPAVRAQLDHLQILFRDNLEGEPLPWGYRLFVGKLGLGTESVSFMPENAFSFGFAENVYAALLEDGETELFVVAETDLSEAQTLAARFTEGFAGYGTRAEETGGIGWIEDRYIKSIAGASASGRWVVGVRGAPSVPTAEAALRRLTEAVASFPTPDGISSKGEPEGATGEGESPNEESYPEESYE